MAGVRLEGDSRDRAMEEPQSHTLGNATSHLVVPLIRTFGNLALRRRVTFKVPLTTTCGFQMTIFGLDIFNA